MNFLAQTFKTDKVPHEADIRKRLTDWIDQLEAVTPTLDLYRVARYADHQVELLRAALAELDNPDEHLRDQNFKYLIQQASRVFPRMPFDRDVESILLTGKALLPEKLADLPDWLAHEAAERERKRVQAEWQRKNQAEERRKREQEQAKAAKIAQFEHEYGVKLERHATTS
jgi:hypothetical protein